MRYEKGHVFHSIAAQRTSVWCEEEGDFEEYHLLSRFDERLYAYMRTRIYNNVKASN